MAKPDKSKPQEPQEQPQEEEVGIGSGPNPALATQLAEQHIRQQKGLEGRSEASLEAMTKPGMSNQELLDAVLAAPVDSLIPWENCILPSKGLYYDNWDGGAIEVRAMNQAAEKILATQRLAQSGEAIDYLFRECCRFQNEMDPADLLLGDRVFILFYLRGITHGNIYEFVVSCPNPECNQSSVHSYDLNKLAETIIWADEALGPEPFKVILPHMSQKLGREFYVHLRFLRSRDGHRMLASRRNKKKALQPARIRAGRAPRQPQQNSQVVFNDTVSENLEMAIVSVMDVADSFKAKQLVKRLHSTDTATIREWLREHSPGIETMLTIQCQHCGLEYAAELPITESFFRPTQRGGTGERVRADNGATVPT